MDTNNHERQSNRFNMEGFMPITPESYDDYIIGKEAIKNSEPLEYETFTLDDLSEDTPKFMFDEGREKSSGKRENSNEKIAPIKKEEVHNKSKAPRHLKEDEQSKKGIKVTRKLTQLPKEVYKKHERQIKALIAAGILFVTAKGAIDTHERVEELNEYRTAYRQVLDEAADFEEFISKHSKPTYTGDGIIVDTEAVATKIAEDGIVTENEICYTLGGSNEQTTDRVIQILNQDGYTSETNVEGMMRKNGVEKPKEWLTQLAEQRVLENRISTAQDELNDMLGEFSKSDISYGGKGGK